MLHASTRKRDHHITIKLSYHAWKITTPCNFNTILNDVKRQEETNLQNEPSRHHSRHKRTEHSTTRPPPRAHTHMRIYISTIYLHIIQKNVQIHVRVYFHRHTNVLLHLQTWTQKLKTYACTHTYVNKCIRIRTCLPTVLPVLYTVVQILSIVRLMAEEKKRKRERILNRCKRRSARNREGEKEKEKEEE